MKKVFFIAALFAGIGSICFAEDLPSDKVEKSIDSNHSNDLDIKSDFIARLLQVANSGKLFDPTTMGHILDLNFETTTKEVVPQPADCKAWGGLQSMKITSSKVSGDNWFHPHPSAVYLMVVPIMDYQISRYKTCSDNSRRAQLSDITSARLSFNGLYSFSCITLEDVEKLLPKAKFSCDYPEYYIKKPCSLYSDMMVNDAVGTELIFNINEDDACVNGVSVIQSQELGWRYKRAEYKYQSCNNVSDRDYCDKHPSLTWGRGVEEMWAIREKTCGTFNSYYEKEPLTGKAPELLPERRHRSSPCEGL